MCLHSLIKPVPISSSLLLSFPSTSTLEQIFSPLFSKLQPKSLIQRHGNSCMYGSLEGWFSEPVSEIATLNSNLSSFGRVLQTFTHKYIWEVCAAHMWKTDVNFYLVPWPLRQTDFLTPLQSQNFKFFPSNPTSPKFKKQYRLQWQFCRRNGGKDIMEISLHCNFVSFSHSVGFSKNLTFTSSLESRVSHVTSWWQRNVGRVMYIVSEHELLRNECAFSNAWFIFPQLEALVGGRPTR